MSRLSLRIYSTIFTFILPSCFQPAAATSSSSRQPRTPRIASVAHQAPPVTPQPTARPTLRPRPTPKPAPKKMSVQDRIRATWPGNDYEAVEIVRCETGGTFNPTIHNRSGKYHGLWQADSSFSRSYAEVPDAHVLSVEDQTRMAWRAYSSGRGYRPWPYCGRRRFGNS